MYLQVHSLRFYWVGLQVLSALTLSPGQRNFCWEWVGTVLGLIPSSRLCWIASSSCWASTVWQKWKQNNADTYQVCTLLFIFSCHFAFVYKQMWHIEQKYGTSYKYCVKHAKANVTLLTVTSRHFLTVAIYSHSQHCSYLHIREKDIMNNKIHGSASLVFKTNFQYLLYFWWRHMNDK